MLLSGGSRHEELDVVSLRGHRRTTGPTVDPGCLDGGDEASVEPAVAALGGSVTLFVVEDHGVIVAYPPTLD
jgi:hypothetical protein